MWQNYGISAAVLNIFVAMKNRIYYLLLIFALNSKIASSQITIAAGPSGTLYFGETAANMLRLGTNVKFGVSYSNDKAIYIQYINMMGPSFTESHSAVDTVTGDHKSLIKTNGTMHIVQFSGSRYITGGLSLGADKVSVYGTSSLGAASYRRHYTSPGPNYIFQDQYFQENYNKNEFSTTVTIGGGIGFEIILGKGKIYVEGNYYQPIFQSNVYQYVNISGGYRINLEDIFQERK